MDIGSVAPFFLFFGLLWVGLCALVGRLAMDRGQNGAGWFLLAIFTSPIVAGLLLFLLTPAQPPDGYR